MVKNFVDYFNTKKYGFNFFPILGIIAAAVLAGGFSILYLFIEGSFKKYSFLEFINPHVVFSSILFGLSLAAAVHLAKKDFHFPLLFGGFWILGGILNRLLSNGSYQSFQIREAYQLFDYLFNIRALIYSFLYAGIIAFSLVLLYRLLKRFDYVVVFAFVAGEIIFSFFQLLADLITRGEIHFSITFTLILPFIYGALKGIFFYIGYWIYMKNRGFTVTRNELKSKGEESAPRTNFLSTKFFFGLFLVLNLIGMAMLYLAVSIYNFRQISERGIFRMDTGKTVSEEIGEHWLSATISQEGLVTVILVLIAFALLASLLIGLYFVYKMWKVVQDGKTDISPAMATGFLLIPGFNLYWNFRAYYSFAKIYNAVVERSRLKIPKLVPGLYLTFCIFNVLSIIAVSIYEVIELKLGIPLLVFMGTLQAVLAMAIVYLTCKSVNGVPVEIYSRNSKHA